MIISKNRHKIKLNIKDVKISGGVTNVDKIQILR